MQGANLGSLLTSDLEPIFWTPERLDKPSAWWGHVPFAFWITVACKPRLLVELGTHYGASYAAFCEAVARSRLETRCYAVDTWAGDEHAGFYGDEIYNELKDFHDKRYASFSELLRKNFDDACSSFADGTIDLLHIDGYHTYEAVRHDFETWRPKLSKRAVVLFHDTNVRNDDFGIWRFFGELKKELPSFEFLHCHGLGLVAVGVETPTAITELCGLTQSDDITAIRERFSHFGARWMAEDSLALAKQELALFRQAHDLATQKNAELEVSLARATQNVDELLREATALRKQPKPLRQSQAFGLFLRTGRLLRASQREHEVVLQKLRDSDLFDAKYYVEHNEDVRVSGADPLSHFIEYGIYELRNPSRFFDLKWYLLSNPDVRAARVNPLLHYIEQGKKEGRRPHPEFDPDLS